MAQRGVNKVILVGNIGKDPEVKTGQSTIANITLATSETWKDKTSGENQERTEWHRVVFFGKLADIVAQYVKKGSKLYIEGCLRTRKWQDQSGQDRYTTEIIASEMQMLDGRQQQDGQQAPQQQSQQRQGYNANGTQQSMPPVTQRPQTQFADDLDIPF